MILPNNHNDIQHKKCGLISKGGIKWHKQHIASWNGDVRPCPNSTDEEKTIYRLNPEAAKVKISDKKAYLKLREKVQIAKERKSEELNLSLMGLNGLVY